MAIFITENEIKKQKFMLFYVTREASAVNCNY